MKGRKEGKGGKQDDLGNYVEERGREWRSERDDRPAVQSLIDERGVCAIMGSIATAMTKTLQILPIVLGVQALPSESADAAWLASTETALLIVSLPAARTVTVSE